MIDLFYWSTPNGHKITMFLEEVGVPYQLIPVNLAKGEQFAPGFLRVSPNNRMPAIVDKEPEDGGAAISVFESGAILLYLAEKFARFLPQALRAQVAAKEWLFWQVAGLGPMAGQNLHFSRYAPEKIPYAIDRYLRETGRLYAVLNKQLQGRPFIAGEYSIADMSAYPWIVPHEALGQNLADFPNLHRWFEAIAARPATLRAYARAGEVDGNTEVTEESRKILFGQSAATPKV